MPKIYSGLCQPVSVSLPPRARKNRNGQEPPVSTSLRTRVSLHAKPIRGRGRGRGRGRERTRGRGRGRGRDYGGSGGRFRGRASVQPRLRLVAGRPALVYGTVTDAVQVTAAMDKAVREAIACAVAAAAAVNQEVSEGRPSEGPRAEDLHLPVSTAICNPLFHLPSE